MPLKSRKLLLAIAPFAIASSTPTLPTRSPIPPASPSSASSTLSFASSLPSPHPIPNSLPTNLDYLKSVVRVVPHPSILVVFCICKPLRPSSHVDIVTAFRHTPTWFLVSDRNSYYFPWLGPKGLRAHIECVIAAAHFTNTLAPASIILDFSSLLANEAASRMVNEFDAIETNFFIGSDLSDELEGWVGVRPKESKVYQIKIDSGCGAEGVVPLGVVEHGGELGSKDRVFGSLILKMSLRRGGDKF